MYESFVTGDSLPEAWHNALVNLKIFGNIVDCPAYGGRCKEIAMTMVVKNPLASPRISPFCNLDPYSLEEYCQEITDGIRDFEIGHGWTYTYHDRMARNNQIEFVIDELKKDPYSRRAVICIRDKDDIGNDDPACMQHIQYMIRDGKLDCFVLFRSNDAVQATFANAYALIRLQKKIADAVGVPIGTYTHRANSFHVYERCWDSFGNMVNKIIKNDLHDYDDMYAEEMANCQDEIDSFINKRKEEINGRC